MKKYYKLWKTLGITLTAAIVTGMLLKIFVFGIFNIPTFSMTPAIQGGDRVLVNKIIYGTRLSCSVPPKGGSAKVVRLKGYDRPRKNDIVVFNPPYRHNIARIHIDPSKFFIKRCLGVPGDTLSIAEARYIVNGKKIYGDTIAQKRLWRERAGLSVDERILPYADTPFLWTVLDYGPIIVPGKNVEITLNSANRFFYQKLVEYENPGKTVPTEGSYTFQKNWYFMAGDNLRSSYDSRYWGVVPEDCIIGKAVLILYARNIFENTWKPERFLKIVR